MTIDPRVLERSTQGGGRVTPIWWSKSVRCTAPAGTAQHPTKAMLVARGDYLHAGGTGRLVVGATLRVVHPPVWGFVTLVDLEATSCWPEYKFGPNPSPGVRLTLDSSGALRVDRRKIGLGDLHLFELADLGGIQWHQPRIGFSWLIGPCYSCFDFDTYQGKLRLTHTDTMVPTAPAISAVTGLTDFAFAREPVYDRIQVGITANASSSRVEVVVERLDREAHR